MKTPQEEAEEMKAKASSFYHTLGMTVRDSIKESIPLPELIAVARAASEVEKLTPFTKFKITEKDIELAAALQALRATGKVEL